MIIFNPEIPLLARHTAAERTGDTLDHCGSNKRRLNRTQNEVVWLSWTAPIVNV
jgi:hypothetical protein